MGLEEPWTKFENHSNQENQTDLGEFWGFGDIAEQLSEQDSISSGMMSLRFRSELLDLPQNEPHTLYSALGKWGECHLTRKVRPFDRQGRNLRISPKLRFLSDAHKK